MKTPIRILPLAAAILLAGCGTSPEEQFSRAQGAFAAEDFNAARIDLTAALKEQPENQAMLLLLARSQVQLGDAEGALATLEKLRGIKAGGAEIARIHAEADLLRGKPDEAYARLASDASPDAWRLRAAVLLDLGKPENALAALRKGQAAGRNARLTSDLAWFLFSANDLAGAQGQLAELEKLAPGGFQGHLLRGQIALRTGHYAAALKAFEAGSAKFPTRFEPLLGKAEALEGLKRLNDAEAAAARAEVLAPGNPKVRAMVLRIAAVQGKWQKVRGLLQEHEDTIEPLSADGMLYAEAMLNLGFAQQARALLSSAILLDPGNMYARGLMGRALLASGDAAGAAEALAPVAGDYMADPEAIGLLAKAAGQAGLPDAPGYAALARSPQYIRRAALIADGEAAMQRLDWNKAIPAYSALLAMDGNAYVLNNLAYAKSRSGLHQEAIVLADQALALQPGAPGYLKTAAMARIAAGVDLPAALAMVRQAQQQTPMDLELVVLAERAAGN